MIRDSNESTCWTLLPETCLPLYACNLRWDKPACIIIIWCFDFCWCNLSNDSNPMNIVMFWWQTVLVWNKNAAIATKMMSFITQLKLDTVEKLSSPIFCCLSVCQASVTPDQISTFSNIYTHTSTLLTQYNLILSSTELYWPSTTMYQPVPPHTDPVPPSISHYRPKLTQFHQVLPHTDPVTPSTGQYRPILSQFHQVPTITVL